MTPEQFEVVADLIRSQESVRKVMRLVLVEGRSSAEARALTGISPQALCNALNRYQTAHHKILTAYGPVPEKGSQKNTK